MSFLALKRSAEVGLRTVVGAEAGADDNLLFAGGRSWRPYSADVALTVDPELARER